MEETHETEMYNEETATPEPALEESMANGASQPQPGVEEAGEPMQGEPSLEQKLSQELAESRERYIRLMADFENFKKRSMKEQSELIRYQGERIIVDLLDVLDNLELAISHSSAEYDKLKAGLELTQKLFVEKLAKWDIRGESAIGKVFDPQRHSALSRVPGADVEPGTVVGELKKPYFYKDKLIRVGEVVVAAEKEPEGS
jgi:molecular chaperone GrpE